MAILNVRARRTTGDDWELYLALFWAILKLIIDFLEVFSFLVKYQPEKKFFSYTLSQPNFHSFHRPWTSCNLPIIFFSYKQVRESQYIWEFALVQNQQRQKPLRFLENQTENASWQYSKKLNISITTGTAMILYTEQDQPEQGSEFH